MTEMKLISGFLQFHAAVAVGVLVVLGMPTRIGSDPDSPPPNPPPENPRMKKGDNPPPISTLEEWREADKRLVEIADEFADLTRRKRELDRRLSETKESFSPGDFGPGSVMARRSMTRMSSDYDALLREGRKLRDPFARTMIRAALSRDELKTLLAKRQAEVEAIPEADRTPMDRNDRERAERWIEGMERSEREGPGHFFLGIFGAELGREIAATVGPDRKKGNPKETRPEREREGNAFAPPSPPRKKPPSPVEMRAELDRLERAHERATMILEKQEREIRRLRKQIEEIEKADQGLHTPEGGGQP